MGVSGPCPSLHIGHSRRPSGKVAVRVRRSRNRQRLPPCSDGRRMGIPYHESPSSREPAVHDHGTPVSAGRGRFVELGHRTVRRPWDRIPDKAMLGARCLAKSTMAPAADAFSIGTPARLGRRVRHPRRDGSRDRTFSACVVQTPLQLAAEAGKVCRRRGHRQQFPVCLEMRATIACTPWSSARGDLLPSTRRCRRDTSRGSRSRARGDAGRRCRTTSSWRRCSKPRSVVRRRCR